MSGADDVSFEIERPRRVRLSNVQMTTDDDTDTILLATPLQVREGVMLLLPLNLPGLWR